MYLKQKNINIINNNKDTIFSLKNLLIFLATLLLLNQRPAILQMYSEYVFLSFIYISVMYVLINPKLNFTKNNIRYIALSLLFCFYLLIQSVFLLREVKIDVIKAIVYIISATIFVIYINRETIWRSFLKAIVYPTIFFSISYFITLIVFLIFKSFDKLVIFHFFVPQNLGKYDMYILFPFSICSQNGTSHLFGYEFTRAVGFFREPGIYQILIVTSFFGLEFLNLKYKNIFKFLLIVQLYLTFSTSGIVSFFVCSFYYYIFCNNNKKKSINGSLIKVSIFTILSIASYWFVFNENKFGLLSKIMSNSGQDRLIQSINAKNAFFENPFFGIGYMNEGIIGINFISTISQVGIIGFLMLLLVILIPNIDSIKKKKPISVLIIPVTLTMLFTQPLFDKALFYCILSLIVSVPNNYTDNKTK